MQPRCLPSQFLDEEFNCVERSICQSTKYCYGLGGSYSEDLNGCFCDKVADDLVSYCDEQCQS